MSTVKITKRIMKRRQRNGEVKELLRYVLHFRDPKTGAREQRFFEKQKEAQAEQSKIITDMRQGTYNDRREAPTVQAAFEQWINVTRGNVKPRSLENYQKYRPFIVGPLLAGNLTQRLAYKRTGQVPEGCKVIEVLGARKIVDLTTAEIREWYGQIVTIAGTYIANRSRQYLKTLLELSAEDCNLRLAPMPKRLGRGRSKEKKAILMPEQVATLLAQAEKDKDYGIYYAFPFLTGVRPSEQLGLLWDDVDLEKKEIRIRRMQEKDGTLCDFTKTVAGRRSIPINSRLLRMLVDWKERCPYIEGQPRRVFPNIGFHRFKDEPRNGGGGSLLYTNFRRRVWHVALKKAELPPVTPHSARHCFISTLQAQGIEVGLVAKLAGHANPAITLSHYTQPVRGGDGAVEGLTAAFQTPAANPVPAQPAA